MVYGGIERSVYLKKKGNIDDSKYTGVSSKGQNSPLKVSKWLATMICKQSQIRLGWYETEELAALAWKYEYDRRKVYDTRGV